MRGRRDDGRLARFVAIGLLAVLAVMALRAMVAIRAELAVERAGLHAQEWSPDEPVPPAAMDRSGPSRRQLAIATLLARAAQATPGNSERRALIRRAEAAVDAAIQARPAWGDAAAVRAFLLTLDDGGASPRALAALRRSYADAPFLRGVGQWRAAFGLSHWQALDPRLRTAVADEAVWLADTDRVARTALFDIARAGPAYTPLLLRWRTMRRRLHDLDGGEGTAP